MLCIRVRTITKEETERDKSFLDDFCSNVSTTNGLDSHTPEKKRHFDTFFSSMLVFSVLRISPP